MEKITENFLMIYVLNLYQTGYDRGVDFTFDQGKR